MSYIPGAGIKKALNQLEGPIYPDIKKGPPRFKWSGKHWLADPAVMRDTEQITQFYEPAILAQARDYNQTVYGQSSHKDIVNAAFRPPLIDPIEDIYPLTRIPATSKTIIPRINPGTAFADGTSGYSARNQRINNIEKHLTDRIKAGEWRPTFFAPIDVPVDNSVLPDLEMTIPSVSASAGYIFPTFDAPTPEVQLDYEQINPLLDPGKTTTVTIDGSSGREGIELYDNRPQVSATAGVNTPVQINGPTQETFLYLPENRPQVSATAGMNTPLQLNGDIVETQLNLDYNRPAVSAGAGMNTPIQLNAPQETEIQLESQINAPMCVVNPGAEDNFKYRMDPARNPEDYIQESHPRYSYVVPATSPAYRAQNELTYRPPLREKLQPLKHYGQISHSSAIPQAGIGQPIMGRSQTPRKAVYSF